MLIIRYSMRVNSYSLYLCMPIFSVFGKTPSGRRLKKLQKSRHYVKGHFRNPVPTDVTLKDVSFVRMFMEYGNKPKNTTPSSPLPSVRTDLRTLNADAPVIVWFGHSSYFINVKGFKILVDPVFSGHASPFSFFARAFPGTDVYTVDDLPDLDIVVLTHDHYDHLDYKTIRQLQSKARNFCVSLGVGAHLEYWGIDPARIIEFDWWDSRNIAPEVTLTATPARHFSGR